MAMKCGDAVGVRRSKACWLKMQEKAIFLWQFIHSFLSNAVNIQRNRKYIALLSDLILLLGLVLFVFLGRVALLRGVAAYSDQTFHDLSVCPVHGGKTADRIRMPFCIIGRTGPGMRQLVGFGDRSTGRGRPTFEGEFGARHCNQWRLYGVRVDYRSDAAIFPNFFGQTCYYCYHKHWEIDVGRKQDSSSTLSTVQTRDGLCVWTGNMEKTEVVRFTLRTFGYSDVVCPGMLCVLSWLQRLINDFRIIVARHHCNAMSNVFLSARVC